MLIDPKRLTRRLFPLCAALILLLSPLAGAPQPTRAGELTPLPDVTDADGRMGTCFSFYDDGSRAGQAHAAGSRWDRFDFRWDVIESTNDNFSFAPHRNVVAIDAEHGLDVVGILWATPSWAACSTTASTRGLYAAAPTGYPRSRLLTADPGSRVPCNLHLPWNDPQNHWGDYVYHVVSEFKDDVHVWELWNEPDLPAFWAGTPEQYAHLLKTGYLAAKAADPDATILFGGLAFWHDQTFTQRVLDHLLKVDSATYANRGYFDVIALHLYSSVDTPYTISRQVTAAVAERVGAHPLWLTETGVPLWDEGPGTPYTYAATAEEAAAYVIEAYASARAAGVERFIVFRLHDESMSEAFGLTRNDYSVRPAYLAYQVAARYLRGEGQIVGPYTTPEGVRRITFLTTPYGRVDVLWNTTGTTLTYAHPAYLSAATLVDVRGETRTIHASGGNYALTLGPATANLTPDGSYLIGGPPLLVIQGDSNPPFSALRPLSQALYTDTLRLTWDAGDVGTGYWYEEIQIAPTPTGPWEKIAGYPETQHATAVTITLPRQGSFYGPWYFRARARDHVGNWEAWPTSAEISTNFSAITEVSLTVTAYPSEQAGTVRLPLTNTTMIWYGSDGAKIARTLTTTWQLTRAVRSGDHRLRMERPGYLPKVIDFTVAPLDLPQTFTFAPILHPLRARLYLPLVARNGGR